MEPVVPRMTHGRHDTQTTDLNQAPRNEQPRKPRDPNPWVLGPRDPNILTSAQSNAVYLRSRIGRGAHIGLRLGPVRGSRGSKNPGICIPGLAGCARTDGMFVPVCDWDRCAGRAGRRTRGFVSLGLRDARGRAERAFGIAIGACAVDRAGCFRGGGAVEWSWMRWIEFRER